MLSGVSASTHSFLSASRSTPVAESSTMEFFRGLVERRSDNVLRKSQSVWRSQLLGLFSEDFRTRELCWFETSSIDDAARQTCPRCAHADERILNLLVQCPWVTDLCIFVEQMLSRIGQIRVISRVHCGDRSTAVFWPGGKGSFPLPGGYSDRGSVVDETEMTGDRYFPLRPSPQQHFQFHLKKKTWLRGKY